MPQKRGGRWTSTVVSRVPIRAPKAESGWYSIFGFRVPLGAPQLLHSDAWKRRVSALIVGNPPFLGDKFMRRELGDSYVEELRKIYGNRIPGQSDLCCYWFEKTRDLIEHGKCNRAGLLATQGIRGGGKSRS